MIGGTTYVATAIGAPGLIEQTGVHRRVILGEVFGDRTAVSSRVARIRECSRAPTSRPRPWPTAASRCGRSSFIWSPFAAFTGAARRPAGVIWNDPLIRETFLAAVD